MDGFFHGRQDSPHKTFPGASSMRRLCVSCVLVALGVGAARGELPADRLERLAAAAETAAASFTPPPPAAGDAAASGLRRALDPLRALLARSKSGADWRDYLDWPALEAQAAAGAAADPQTLRRLQELFDAPETGLDMPDFVGVRRALTRYAEAADAARGTGAARFGQRLTTLAGALRGAASGGSNESLATMAPTLERIVESGQADGLVREIRGSFMQPNILLAVQERFVNVMVDRPIDRPMPVDEVVLGTRVRGMGRTTGKLRVDFVPSADRAAVDLILAARNVSTTRGSRGPVTVHSLGTTELGARRRVFVTPDSIAASSVEASADTDSQITGIGVSSRCGRRLIRKIASRKVAQSKPQAEAIAAGRARDRLRHQFAEQTSPVLAQFLDLFRSRVRAPLEARGLYPEALDFRTSATELVVAARKAQAAQFAAASPPPVPDPGNVATVSVHESAVNNILEQRFGGVRFTQDDVAKMAKEFQAPLPESLEGEAEQQSWAVTFAKHRPITVSAGDGRVKLMVRGDKFVSGEREFPGMDIWATYAIGRAPFGIVLVREGDVQIYPPGFRPGTGEKLSPAETSLRRILQRRFDKLLKATIEIPDIEPQGQMATLGRLPMNELVARRDGWIVAGWRQAGGAGTPAPVVTTAAVPSGPVMLTSFTLP
jgi:hypothetical protein